MLTLADVQALPPDRIDALYSSAGHAAVRAISTFATPPEIANAPRVRETVLSTLRTARSLYDQSLGHYAGGRRAEAAWGMLTVCDVLLRAQSTWAELAREYPRVMTWIDSSAYRDAIYGLTDALAELASGAGHVVREAADTASGIATLAVLGLLGFLAWKAKS